MPDDLTPPGFAAPVATDEISGKHYQWIKLGFGAADAFTPVAAADPLPVTVAAANDLATETTLDALVAAVARDDKLEQVRSLLADVVSNTDGLELSLTDIDLNTDALEQALIDLYTELGQKLEAGSLTGLATAAHQVNHNTHLTNVAENTWQTKERLPTALVDGRLPVAVGNSVTINSPSLAASTSRIGTIGRRGWWHDITATALGASGIFTGGALDLTSSAAGEITNGYVDETRVVTTSDAPGQMHFDISRDGTTWRRIRTVDTVLQASGVYTCELLWKPATRYCRVAYTNSTTAQTHFMAQAMFT